MNHYGCEGKQKGHCLSLVSRASTPQRDKRILATIHFVQLFNQPMFRGTSIIIAYQRVMANRCRVTEVHTSFCRDEKPTMFLKSMPSHTVNASQQQDYSPPHSATKIQNSKRGTLKTCEAITQVIIALANTSKRSHAIRYFVAGPGLGASNGISLYSSILKLETLLRRGLVLIYFSSPTSLDVHDWDSS